METILYRLDAFEGPLDLLLTLIQKNKVSIWDIPIVEITDQYMEILEKSDVDTLDNAGEFLVMASQLLLIKSKLLLPKNEEEEEEEDPREDLARRLFEYKIYKEASSELRKNEFARQNMVFRDTEKIDFPIPPYSRHHELEELINAFDLILSRRLREMKPEKRAFSGIVGREKVSVEDMSEKIRNRLKKSGRITFKSLFYGNISKPEMIATFLAVLEMIKLNRLYADFDTERGDFILTGEEHTDE